MTSLSQYMNNHHKLCEERFARVELSAQAEEWGGCVQAAEDYAAFMEAHFRAEEEILMPPILATSPRSGAMLSALVEEHRVMRTLLRELVQAAKSARPDEFFGTADGLLILMQQHYLKEERSLYPLGDNPALDQAAIVAKLERALGPGGQTPGPA